MTTHFTTSKYQFTIDGSPYVMEKLTFGDRALGDRIAEVAGDGPATMKLFEEILEKRADARTRAAIDTLTIPQAVQLFREWAGLTAGESSSSVESSETTEPSSPSISDTSAAD